MTVNNNKNIDFNYFNPMKKRKMVISIINNNIIIVF